MHLPALRNAVARSCQRLTLPYALQKLGKIARQRFFETHALATDGMAKTQGGGVQHRSRCELQSQLSLVNFATINRFSEQRMACFGEVDANLVLAASFKAA